LKKSHSQENATNMANEIWEKKGQKGGCLPSKKTSPEKKQKNQLPVPREKSGKAAIKKKPSTTREKCEKPLGLPALGELGTQSEKKNWCRKRSLKGNGKKKNFPGLPVHNQLKKRGKEMVEKPQGATTWKGGKKFGKDGWFNIPGAKGEPKQGFGGGGGEKTGGVREGSRKKGFPASRTKGNVRHPTGKRLQRRPTTKEVMNSGTP